MPSMKHCRILSSKLDAYITAYQGSQINMGEEGEYCKAKVVDNSILSLQQEQWLCQHTQDLGMQNQESEGEVILSPNSTKGILANNVYWGGESIFSKRITPGMFAMLSTEWPHTQGYLGNRNYPHFLLRGHRFGPVGK